MFNLLKPLAYCVFHFVFSRGNTQIEALKSSFAEEVDELKRERDSLEQQLDIEKTATAAEKKKSAALHDQIKERDRKIAQLINTTPTVTESRHSTPRSSPTPSLSRISLAGSISEFSGSQWGVRHIQIVFYPIYLDFLLASYKMSCLYKLVVNVF